MTKKCVSNVAEKKDTELIIKKKIKKRYRSSSINDSDDLKN